MVAFVVPARIAQVSVTSRLLAVAPRRRRWRVLVDLCVTVFRTGMSLRVRLARLILHVVVMLELL